MEDVETIKRILDGGEIQLYAEVMRRYSNSVYSVVLRLVKREDMAQEITQQTFIRAYTRLNYWHGGSLGAWLSSIAQHLALNELEKQRRRRTEPIDENAMSIPDEENLEEHERLLACMRAALRELPEQERLLLNLHYYKRLKTDEIARRLGLTQSNVLVKLHRIREKLKKTLMEKNNGDDE